MRNKKIKMQQRHNNNACPILAMVRMIACCLPLFCAKIAPAQTAQIVLLSPLEPVSFPETREFATTEVAGPWDMDQIRDIPFDINFLQPAVSNGIWRGVSINLYPAISPLFRGYSTPQYEQYASWYDRGIPYGQINPLDAGRYTRLSMRMRIPKEKRSSIALYWTKNYRYDEYGTLAGLAQPPHFMGFIDGENAHSRFIPNTSDFRIYDIDLTGQNFFEEQNSKMFDSLVYNGSWDETIYGILIQPSQTTPIGTPVEIDWIRAYNASAGNDLTVKWETPSIIPSEDIYVRIYLDSDNQGYDGDLFASGVVNDGSFRLRTGALPPGVYYLYLQLMNRGLSENTSIDFSAYSAPITILAAPILEFTAPSMTSGADYATTEIGIPWDMTSSACIKSYSEITVPVFSNGVMTATAMAPTPPKTESDSSIFLNTRSGSRNKPIDTTLYRYLTFSMKVETAGYTNIQDRISRGWVTRLIWGASDYLDKDGSYSKSVCLLEDWHHYTVDLWDPALLEDDPALTTVAQAGWTNIRHSTFFRFDPLEVYNATTFHLDDIKLCAINEARDNVYCIMWNTTDPDSERLLTTLFLGQTNAAGIYSEFPTPLGVVTQAANCSTSFMWTVHPDLPDGEYFIRASTTDGANIVSRKTFVPIKVRKNPQPTAPVLIWAHAWGWPGAYPVSGDYDGDMLNDLAVFDKNTGLWYIVRHDNEVLAWGAPWGWPGAVPVPGDYNGDGKADLAVFDSNAGRWYIRTLQNSIILFWKFPYGWPGAVPVPGDYNNDGISDFCLFDPRYGRWYMTSLTAGIDGTNWGWPGAMPVPGDYNGDAYADLAVFDNNSGYWFILNYLNNTPILWALPWGWPGAVPVPGDYDGDSRNDLAVFDSNTGFWYILGMSGDLLAWALPWGWPGAAPVPGNYVEDAADDLTVFDSNTGFWYSRPLLFP